MAATQYAYSVKIIEFYLLKIATFLQEYTVLPVCYVLVTTPYAGHSFISILPLCDENATAGMFSYVGAVCTEL